LLSPQLSTTINLFNTFSQFVFGFQGEHLNTLIVSLWPLTVLLVFLSLRKNQKIPPLTVYFFLAALLPVATAFLVSILLRPLFLTRYLILAAPSLFLFLAWLFDTYPKKISITLKSSLVIIMLFLLFNQAQSAQTPVKENYNEVVQYLNSNATAQDVLVISAPFTIYPIEYYYKGPAGMVTFPLWDRYKTGPIPEFNESAMPQDVEKIKSGHQKAYLILSYDQGYEYKLKYYFDTHFEKLEEKNFSPGLNLYVYKLRYDN
jgi:mannosyltransferase